ncbi:hypothetical protein AWB70_01048 [Caballeronia cordobensis]|uniref:Uncharacterized protein n=1 Tax=Caballeronia cordobensis TaxID=1353886 RepID=A0A158FKU1_CABCO|nr:hypothetical protein [Caballeronia cordobensis]SAL20526.1 hypothetical protein AWB70_01048 [Caballeronia cordobensis]
MFDVDDVFEGFSIWLNMWARAAFVFARALDDTSDLFARGDD